MKRGWWMLLALCALGTAHAQNYVYCEIVGTNTAIFGKQKIAIRFDFGNEQGAFINNPLADEAGKPARFNSMIDALNWMAAQGWEFSDAYAVGDAREGYTYHYLLRNDLSRLPEPERMKVFELLRTRHAFRLEQKQERAEEQSAGSNMPSE